MKNRISLTLAIPLLSGLYLVVLFALFPTITHAQPVSLQDSALASLASTDVVTPDLSLTVSVTPTKVKNTEPVTFTFEVINQGDAPAEAITLTAYLPLPYVEVLDCQLASGASCQQEEFAYRAHFATLAVNQHLVMTIEAKARSGYVHTTTTYAPGVVASSSIDSNLLNNRARAALQLDNPVDLVVTQQVAGSTALLPNEPVTMTVEVSNLESNPLFLQQQQFFKNPALVEMPDTTLFQLEPAIPYPSVITVSGVADPVVGVEVTFFSITRTWTEDMDILLVSPTGVSVTLLSDVGGATELGAIDLTFSDNATEDATNQDIIPPGIYHPTNFAREDESLYDTYPDPGPGDVLDPVPYLGRLNGLDPNGEWKLYIIDDQPKNTGAILGGWGITFTTKTTSNVPLQLEHIAPDLTLADPISATGWIVTRTAQGFIASTVSAEGEVPSPIVLHATTPITPGVHPFTSTIQSVAGEENVENNVVQTDLEIGSLSDLGLTGLVTPTKAIYEDKITYLITVTNHGPTFAPSSKLNILVADALSVITTTTSQGNCSISGARVTCDTGDLPIVAGLDQMTVTILADTPGGGLPGPYTIVTTATLESAADPVSENNALALESELGDVIQELLYLPLITR